MELSRPLLYNEHERIPGSRLMFVGDSFEHINRVGSTIVQYVALSGSKLDRDYGPNAHFFERRMIIEDVERDSDDTVVAGGFMDIVRAGDTYFDYHLKSLFVREEYRNFKVASFIVNYLIQSSLDSYPSENLFVEGVEVLPDEIRRILAQKGFREEDDPAKLALRLPGYIRGHDKTPIHEVRRFGLSGIYGGDVYRGGVFQGGVRTVLADSDNIFSERSTLLLNTDGTVLETWQDDEFGVDMQLSAAIRILNPPPEDEDGQTWQ